MRAGILLEIGGSLRALEASGQLRRFLEYYLGPYQRAFGEVVIFSYATAAEEGGVPLPAGVRVMPRLLPLRPHLYSLFMPFLYRADIRQCTFLRIFQMDTCLPALISRWLWGVPYIGTYGYPYEKRQRVEGKPLSGFFLKFLLRSGTRWAESMLVQWGGLWEEIHRRHPKVTFQPNGVDLKVFRKLEKYPHEGKNIFFVGRLVHQKNVALLIEAASLLRGVSLHLIGEGPLRRRLMRLAHEKKVHATFYGNVPYHQIPELLRQADLFVMPSLFEGHVKSLTEAMACGIPCVGTDVDGLRELVQHEKTGWLSPPTPDGLANGIRRLLEDAPLAERLGEGGRRFVEEHFDLGRLVEDEICWIKEIMKPAGDSWRALQRRPAPRPLSICFVNEYFHPFSIGGGEISTFLQARALVQEGHRVTVVTPNYGAPSQDILEGVEVCRFPFPKKLAAGEECNSLYFMNPFFWMLVVYHVFTLSRRKKFDLIHAQNSFSVLGGFMAAKLVRKPFVITLRDYLSVCSLGAFCLQEKTLPPRRCGFVQNERCMFEFLKRYAPDRGSLQKAKLFLRTLWAVADVQFRRWAIRRAHRIVVVSEAVLRIYQETGIDARRLIRIPNLSFMTVPATTIPSTPGRLSLSHNGGKRVLFVGKLSLGKGVDVLFDAIPRILESVPKTSFVFAGRLTQAVRIPHAVRPHIQLLGHLPHEEVDRLYDLCDLVVIPSVWPEPYPRVALEAIAHHKPIVASRVGGIPEIVQEGISGRLVERRDPVALAEAIITLLSMEVHPLERKKDSILPEDEAIVHRWHSLYRDLIVEEKRR